MEVVISIAILTILGFAALQFFGAVIKLLWSLAPSILFIALIVMYLGVQMNEGNQNAEHTRLTKTQDTSGKNTAEWLHDKVFPTPVSGSEGE